MPPMQAVTGNIQVAAIGDNLAAILDRGYDDYARRVTEAVRTAGEELKEELRTQIRTNFHNGGRLANAVRRQGYPRGQKWSASAASLVYITVPWIAAHIDGATITAQGGRWLVIPTAEAEARGYDRHEDNRSSFGRFVKGANAGDAMVGKAVADFGGLVYRQLAPDRAVLAARLGKGLLPLFVLVRTVRLKPRLDVDGPARRAQDRLAVLLRDIG